MKKIILLAISSFLISTALQAQVQKFQDIVGNWDVVGEQNTGASLQVVDSTTIILTYMGERRIITNYKMDFSKSPCWFDFSASDSSSVVQVKSLMQRVGDDVLKWQLFVDEDRSPSFTSNKGELLYLKKSRPVGGAAVAATH